jgi:hypothetical protein
MLLDQGLARAMEVATLIENKLILFELLRNF